MKRCTVLPPVRVFHPATNTTSQTWHDRSSRREIGRQAKTDAQFSSVYLYEYSSEEVDFFEGLRLLMAREKGRRRLISSFAITPFSIFLLPLSLLLLFAVVMFAQLSYAQAPNGTIPATFFGMTFSGGNAPSEYAAQPAAITSSMGTMGKESAAEWSYIEQNAPTGSGCPGTTNCTHTYNWTVLDGYVNTAFNHGLPFMFFFTEAPPWATNSVGCRSIAPGQACRGPIVSGHTADQQAFVTALVTRYGSKIGSYELGNEEDYQGTWAQYAAQSDLYVKAIKAVSPSALIVGMGWDHPDGHYAQGGDFDQFWSAWGAIPNNSRHLDVVSFHGYPHTFCAPSCVVPEIVISNNGLGTQGSGNCATTGYAKCIQNAIARNGVTSFRGGTPLLRDTEGSWGTANYTIPAPAFISRMLLLNWAAGVSEHQWSYPDGGSVYGQLDGITANISAYQQTYNWMAGSTPMIFKLLVLFWVLRPSSGCTFTGCPSARQVS